MESNTFEPRPAERPDRLAALTAAVEALDGQDLDGRDLQGLTDAALAEPTLQLRQLLDRLEGHWLQHLAAVDAWGAPGPTRASRWARPRPGPRATISGTGWMVAHRPGQPGPAVPGSSPGRP
jgi:hypothetical protein